MKAKIIRLFAAALVIALMLPLGAAAWTNDLGTSVQSPEKPYNSYTYWYDIDTSEKVPVYAKPMYTLKTTVELHGTANYTDSRFSDMASHDGNTYILDGGTGKVYILDREYAVHAVIETVTYNGETLDFTGAKGLYVDKNGLLYIADTENGRVIVTDASGRATDSILLPDSPLIPTEFSYQPVKVSVDSNGYIYIVSQGSYYGAILYSPEKEFLGFFGANTVKGTVKTVLANLYNRFFANDTKRAADAISLPYTLTDITVGPDNFVYTATGKTTTDGLETGQVCLYNPGGKNILKNPNTNFADYAVGLLSKKLQTQDLSSIAVDERGYMYLLDATYGRVFVYDRDTNLLTAFGGSLGESDLNATFYMPSAIETVGSDVLVLDGQKNNVTVFGITAYGQLVKQADDLTLDGQFSAAYPLWTEVNTLDGNSQLAYRGIAKALCDQGDYQAAMDYAYMGYDRETYATAYKQVRNAWLEENFTWLALCVIGLAAGITALLVLKKKKGMVWIKNRKTAVALSCWSHPVESFREIKEKNAGSLPIAILLLVLFYVVTVLRDTSGGFIFTVFDAESYNSLYVLLSTVGLVVLWTVSNWLVCTLLGGIGKFREIFVVTCYCLIPMIAGYAIQLILTHVLTKDEGAFLYILVYALTLYAAFMLIIGIMRIQDYEFGKFVATTALSLATMLIIIFLLFLVFMLSQQIYGWLITVYTELKY